MANDRVTIRDLVERVKDLRETVDRLDKLNGVMQTDPDIHDSTARALKDKYDLTYEPIYLLNGARNKLSEYADLLERIMRETQLPWPPSLDMTDQN